MESGAWKHTKQPRESEVVVYMHAKDKRKDNETKTCSRSWRSEQKTRQDILFIEGHPRAMGCKMK
jgi:hypothetical protein